MKNVQISATSSQNLNAIYILQRKTAIVFFWKKGRNFPRLTSGRIFFFFFCSRWLLNRKLSAYSCLLQFNLYLMECLQTEFVFLLFLARGLQKNSLLFSSFINECFYAPHFTPLYVSFMSFFILFVRVILLYKLCDYNFFLKVFFLTRGHVAPISRRQPFFIFFLFWHLYILAFQFGRSRKIFTICKFVLIEPALGSEPFALGTVYFQCSLL